MAREVTGALGGTGAGERSRRSADDMPPTVLLRHQAGARLIGQYDANNTYQYIVNREEAQLTWVATAIRELGYRPNAVARSLRSNRTTGRKARARRARDGVGGARLLRMRRPRGRRSRDRTGGGRKAGDRTGAGRGDKGAD